MMTGGTHPRQHINKKATPDLFTLLQIAPIYSTNMSYCKGPARPIHP